MVNVLQPFVPRQVPDLPKPSLSLISAETRGAGIANLAAALDELSEVHTASPLLQVAKARLASLLVAPDPPGAQRDDLSGAPTGLTFSNGPVAPAGPCGQPLRRAR